MLLIVDGRLSVGHDGQWPEEKQEPERRDCITDLERTDVLRRRSLLDGAREQGGQRVAR